MKGFFLVEILIVILILAVAFTAFMGATARMLGVSYRSTQLTDAIGQFGPLLFELENGLRPDLTSYGGRGPLGTGYEFEIQNQKSDEITSALKSRILWNNKKGSLELELVTLEAPAE